MVEDGFGERFRNAELLYHGKRALALIEDHDVVYLDGGSTLLMLARLLDQRKDLTIVTNSLMAAAALFQPTSRGRPQERRKCTSSTEASQVASMSVLPMRNTAKSSPTPAATPPPPRASRAAWSSSRSPSATP
jgi:hypothetical protein